MIYLGNLSLFKNFGGISSLRNVAPLVEKSPLALWAPKEPKAPEGLTGGLLPSVCPKDSKKISHVGLKCQKLHQIIQILQTSSIWTFLIS